MASWPTSNPLHSRLAIETGFKTSWDAKIDEVVEIDM
jgi:hypothetical protein